MRGVGISTHAGVTGTPVKALMLKHTCRFRSSRCLSDLNASASVQPELRPLKPLEF